MRIDLHTHSRVSDGTQSPAELIDAAITSGLDVLGMTDHDTTASWVPAAAAPGVVEGRITLIRGIEVSTSHRGAGVHLLAFLPDPTNAPLQAELGRIVDGREQRVPAMLAKLRELGIPATAEALAEVSGDAAVTGRPHVADLLVRLGAVADRDEAFARYLAQDGPAYVDRYAADLTTVIGLIVAARGVAVIAHPWGRGSDQVLDREALGVLRDAGLAGIEVDHLDHDAAQRAQLRAIAADLDLIVTGASDHHGAGKVDHDLGCETTTPASLERIVALAAAQGSPTAPLGKALPWT